MFKKVILLVSIIIFLSCFSQQDPHFTQYMYNTMTINPAYVGSRDCTIITLMGRTQWVGFKGTPDTQTLSYDTSLNYSNLGLGINIMNDMIGPTQEICTDINVSYNVQINQEAMLAFGLKTGTRIFSLNENSLQPDAPLDISLNTKNKLSPTIGTGLYYYTDNYYLGISVPNILTAKNYNPKTISVRRIHFFGIAGYIIPLNKKLSFKPATILKLVGNSPLSLDISANFKYENKIETGFAWRLDDSVSALLAFQVYKNLKIGYAYDLTTSRYKVTNKGTHEIMLKYSFFNEEIILSPRFF